MRNRRSVALYTLVMHTVYSSTSLQPLRILGALVKPLSDWPALGSQIVFCVPLFVQ